MKEEKVLKVGAIGCGGIFNFAHLPAWVDTEDAQLIALYDIDHKHLEQTKQRYLALLEKRIKETESQVPNENETEIFLKERADFYKNKLENITIYSDVHELIKDVDVIDVCTSVKYHAPYAIMGLEHNVHAMTEKPMARTWWEAKKLVKAVEKSEAFYQLNDDNIFLPRYQLMKNIIEGGMIGDIQSCWIARGSHGPEWSPWFWNPQISGGGCLMDYGTHAVTSLWYLIGFDKEPTEVKSIRISTRHKHRPIENRLTKISVDDDAHFKVMFRDPTNNSWITMVIEATWSWPELGEDSGSVSGFIRIQGSNGELTGYRDKERADWIKISGIEHKDKLMRVPETDPEIDSIRGEIRSFLSCARQNKKPVLNEKVGLGVMQVLGSAYLSEVRDRKTITLKEFRRFNHELSSKYKSDEELENAVVDFLMKPYGR